MNEQINCPDNYPDAHQWYQDHGEEHGADNYTNHY